MRQNITVAFVGLGLVFWVFMATWFRLESFDNDLKLFFEWGESALQKGISLVYVSGVLCNYHPLPVYIFAAFVDFWGSFESAFTERWWLRIFVFPADLLIVWLVLQLSGRINDRRWWLAALALMANPAWWYNTWLWGQVDAWHSAFGLLALWLVLTGRVGWSMVAWLVALNFKLQAVVFLPVLGLLWLQNLAAWRTRSFWYSVAVGAVFQVLVLWPFIQAGQLPSVWREVIGAVGFHANITMNAFNIWFLLPGRGVLLYGPDTQLFMGWVPYKLVGFMLFGCATALALMRPGYEFVKRKKISQSVALQATVCIALGFFLFNTQMHERYAVPAFGAAWALAYADRRYMWPAVLLSCGIFLNHELVLQTFSHPVESDFNFWRPCVAAILLTTWVWFLAKSPTTR